MKIVINALQYKQNSSGIGVMIRDLFGAYTKIVKQPCEVVVPNDAPPFPAGDSTKIISIPWRHGQGLRRLWFQTVQLGRHYGKNAVLLTTDSKIPFFLPKSCVAVPLITDLAVYRMPKVYKASRVFLWRVQFRYVKRRANFFLTISRFSKEEMIELLHIDPNQIYVVPCACSPHMARVEDSAQLEGVRKKYALPDQYVLFVGNSNPRKNLSRLMRAFDRVKEQSGIPHQLVIAGEQGWKFDRAQALRELKHPEAVLFIGFVPDEDMPALYSAASLFTFPTLYEGFGIPVIEAQSCETPVLTSNCSSLPEVGGDGALYVDPYCEEEIEKGILKIIQDPQFSQALSRKGRENAKRFSWQTSAELLDEIIKKEVRA